MNTLEREQIGRLIRRFAAKAATDDLLVLIAETDGLLEACKRLLAEAKDPVTAAWLQSECEAAKTRPGLFLAEIEDILTVIKPSQEHADLYALLELEPGSGREAIKRNYRQLSRRYHPDAGGSEGDEDTFIRITKAYQQLMASAKTTETELPAPRRENSHWRRSLVPDITEARRTQKRRNVVMVALLSLTLIFVSLLAARTYNSHVMMSGLKNKSLALVPPTVGDQTPPATTPSAPTTASTEAQQPPKNPTTKAAASSPTPPDAHAAKVGCAPRTNCNPSAQTTASAEAQPPPENPTPTSAAPSPTPPDEHAAKVGCAARTDCDPSAPTTAGTAAQPTPTNTPPTETIASTTPPVAIEAEQAAVTRNAAPPIADPAPPADEPAVQLTPGKRKKAVPPAAVATHHQAVASPGPATATTSPATAPVETAPTPAAEAAPAKPALAATSPASAATMARTEAQPTLPPPPATPPAAATTTPAPALAATTTPAGTTTTDHPAPTAAATKKPPQPRERIDAFLHAYTAAYEQKNLPTFARFFAADATENGKTLNEVLSAYRELFTKAQTLRFTVSPQDYEHYQGQLHLRGRFTIAMTFKDDVTTSGQGDITFRLTDTTPPQVQTLRYTFDQ